MAVVIAALLPVFILILLGVVLRRSLMRLDTQWHGLERLTYFVLFPMLLIQTLVKADLSKVPVAGVGGALLLSALAMSGWRWPRSRWSRSFRWSTCSASPCSRKTPRPRNNPRVPSP